MIAVAQIARMMRASWSTVSMPSLLCLRCLYGAKHNAPDNGRAGDPFATGYGVNLRDYMLRERNTNRFALLLEVVVLHAQEYCKSRARSQVDLANI